MMQNDLNVVIGLEVHCQITKLKSKLFCKCSSDYRDEEPNQNVCEICIGLPGTLPVLSKRSLDLGIKLAMTLNCDIAKKTIMHRKHYYYPDMPKNFQITQFEGGGGIPIGKGGNMEIVVDGKKKNIIPNRVHLEEDPAKLSYRGSISNSPYTLVDFNRSGIALLEVVTEPVFKSSIEVRTFLRKLKLLLEQLMISDGDLEGALRCDCNISIEGGERVEIKNISSFKEVERAIAYEILRQRNRVRENLPIVRETRHWDDERRTTISSRSKEFDQDYRYFPESDLAPIVIDDKWLNQIKNEMPELPEKLIVNYIKQYKIPDQIASVIANNLEIKILFDKIIKKYDNPVRLSGLLFNLYGFVKENNLEWNNVNINENNILELLKIIDNKTISENAAKKVLLIMIKEGKQPSDIVDEENLKLFSKSKLNKLVIEIIKQNSSVVKETIKDPKIINYLVGKVMNQTKGSADPQETYDLILDNIKNDENVVEIIDSKKQVIVKRSDDIDDIGKWRKTHFTTDISMKNENEEIMTMGWVEKMYSIGGIKFLLLRDMKGILQIAVKSNEATKEILNKVVNLSVESAIAVKGRVKRDERAPRGIELIPTEMKILSKAAKIPFDINRSDINIDTQFNYRSLSLRSKRTRSILLIRESVAQEARSHFMREGFIETFSPKIIGSATEGGTELFPILYYGKEAFLSQSPQLHKQVATLGFEKVFEMGPYFRAQASHTTRHLTEFWSIDVEKAFATDEIIMEDLEKLVFNIWKNVLEKNNKEIEFLKSQVQVPKLPFDMITYEKALEIATSKGIKIEWGEDLSTPAEKAVSEEFKDPFFITGFPIDIRSFYYAHKDDKRTKSFDLVAPMRNKSIELSSGGQRLHNYEELENNMKKRNLNPEGFGWYLEAFKYGVPPHAGFGLGLERIVQVIASLDNIQEAIAYPRTTERLKP